VPIVPGTKGLVESADEAARESERLGFPVMLKGMAIFQHTESTPGQWLIKKQRLVAAEEWAW
jgi:hypothetical protein